MTWLKSFRIAINVMLTFFGALSIAFGWIPVSIWVGFHFSWWAVPFVVFVWWVILAAIGLKWGTHMRP